MENTNMNIGITTFLWSNNYGAVLQAHALQFFLQKRGHAVQIIDYRVKPPVTGLRKWIAKTPSGCVRKWETAYKEYIFESFRKRYLVLTPSVFDSVDGLESIGSYFDVVITGSDQVWNPNWLAQVEGFSDLYFLSFAGTQTRRISYAASIGHSEKATMEEAWQKILSEKLKQMDAISVREASGIELVSELCGRTDAVHVVDPTLLLDRTYYEKIAGKAKRKNGMILNYMLHGLEQDADEACRQIAESQNFHIVKCDVHKTSLHRGYHLPSPSGWLREIRDASFVVTNSFHGTVFCLIFHVPFIALLIGGNIGSMNSRIVDLLSAVGLTNRIISVGDYVTEKIFNGEIDWSYVDEQIVSMKFKSINFFNEQGL
jgi:hypothetical protein